MSKMFFNAESFDQDLGDWPIKNLEDATGMFSIDNFGSVGLTTDNYSNLLKGWADQAPDIQEDVTLGANSIKYNQSAKSARETLTRDFNWDITDNGCKNCSP